MPAAKAHRPAKQTRFDDCRGMAHERRPQISEADAVADPGACRGLGDFLGFRNRPADRLLAQHMLAAGNGAEGDVTMHEARHGDDDSVDLVEGRFPVGAPFGEAELGGLALRQDRVLVDENG